MASSKDKGRSKKRQVQVDENSPVIKAFRGYQTELDTKHDRHERIVKLSRDITIESKRVIFLLQRCAGGESEETQAILQQAQSKLDEIQQTKFLAVALELVGQDPYQFIRAYSPGLQEYIEAVSFYHYLKDGSLVSISQVEKDLQFPRPSSQCDSPTPNVSSTEVSSTSDTTAEVSIKKEPDVCPIEKVSVTIPPMEFMLGIADLTGELMRTAIMSVSAGNLDLPVQICKFMRVIHDAFLSYGNTARDLTRKMATLRQSLHKVENACYTLKVRGSELPKHMLADIFTTTSAEGLFDEDVDAANYD